MEQLSGSNINEGLCPSIHKYVLQSHTHMLQYRKEGDEDNEKSAQV